MLLFMCLFGLSFGLFAPRSRGLQVDHLQALADKVFSADCHKANADAFNDCLRGNSGAECSEAFERGVVRCAERQLRAGGQDGFSDGDFGDSSGFSSWRRRLALTVKRPSDEQIAGCYYRADVAFRNCVYDSKANEDQADQAGQVKACASRRARSEAQCEFFSYATLKQLKSYLEAAVEAEADPRYESEEFGSCATAANFDNAVCRHFAFKEATGPTDLKAQQADCDAARTSQVDLCPSS